MAQPQVLGMALTEKGNLPPSEWAARDGGLEAWRQRHNDCKSCQRTREDRYHLSGNWFARLEITTVMIWAWHVGCSI